MEQKEMKVKSGRSVSILGAVAVMVGANAFPRDRKQVQYQQPQGRALPTPDKRCKRRWDSKMRRATKSFPFDDIRAAKRKEYKRKRRALRQFGVQTWMQFYSFVVEAECFFTLPWRMKTHANQEESSTPTTETYGVSEFDAFFPILEVGRIAEEHTREILSGREPATETDYCHTLFESLAEDRDTYRIGVDPAVEGSDQTVIATVKDGEVIDIQPLPGKPKRVRKPKPKPVSADVEPVEGRSDPIVPGDPPDLPRARKARVSRRVQPEG